MIKVFGRQLLFKFHHLIYDYYVDEMTPNCALSFEKVGKDELEKIDMGYFSLRMLKRVLRKNPNASECYGFMADDGTIVGFALLSYKGSREIHYKVKQADAFITALGVFKQQRGKGYSQEVLKGVVDICRKKNMKLLSLSVDSENLIAVGAYEKFGFKKRGERRFIRFASVDFLFNKKV